MGELLFEVDGQKREPNMLYYVKFDGENGNLCVYKVKMTRGGTAKESLNEK